MTKCISQCVLGKQGQISSQMSTFPGRETSQTDVCGNILTPLNQSNPRDTRRATNVSQTLV